MQDFKEYTAKTAEEAIEAGLKDLNLTRETAEIRILEEGKKKLFGAVKARVAIAPLCDTCEKTGAEACADCKKNSSEEKEESAAEQKERRAKIHTDESGKTDGERAVEFLEGLFEIMKITAATELVSEDEKIVINVTAANNNALIGRKGVVLDAAQTLAGAVANTGREDYKRVVVDCENYRENREETLQRLANNLAAKAVRLGRKIRLEPMNPYERRIIHAALTDNEEVTTESEGKEPNRYIVIIPAGVEDDRPALYAGNDRREGGNRNGYGNNYGRNNGRFNRNDRGNGNRGGYGGRNNGRGAKGGFNRDRRMSGGDRSSVYKKPDSDFFGTFLGNSGNDGKDDE
ncbi:MAG: protein jag [Clostridiales bacterium]|nr:protein jag [Clostridiales bacterium]MDY4895360.1 RNA-binding cell elongation regulator Jag/EloR [Christensenellaceae bacterium]